MRYAALIPLLLAACRGNPFLVEEPPIELKSVEGTVRAWDQERARIVMSALEWYARRVRAMLGAPALSDSRAGPLPIIWLAREPLINGAHGSVRTLEYDSGEIESRILIGSAREDALHEIVPHELAHWYMCDKSWQGLPQVIEEGVADYVAWKANDALAIIHERFPRPTAEAMQDLLLMDDWTPAPEDRARRTDAIRAAAVNLVLDFGITGVWARAPTWNTREVMIMLGWLDPP